MSHTLLILKIYTTFKDVQMMLKWFFDISTGLRFSKIRGECSVHSCSCPCIRSRQFLTFSQFWTKIISFHQLCIVCKVGFAEEKRILSEAWASWNALRWTKLRIPNDHANQNESSVNVSYFDFFHGFSTTKTLKPRPF